MCTEKHPPRSGPMQFKPVSFKGQVYLETSQELSEVEETPVNSKENEAKGGKVTQDREEQGFQARLLRSLVQRCPASTAQPSPSNHRVS